MRCRKSPETDTPEEAPARAPPPRQRAPDTVPSAVAAPPVDATLRDIVRLLARMEVQRLTRRSQRGVTTKRTLVWIMLAAFVGMAVGLLQAR